MYSIRMMPFLTSRPISRIAPMNDETFSGVPVIQSANRALASEIGWARKIRIGSARLRNWKPSSRKTSAAATIRTSQQAGERLLLCPVAPRQLPAVAGGEFQRRQLRLQLAIDRAQVAASPARRSP